MIQVIVFGSVPLATWAAQKISEYSSAMLRGIICEHKSREFSHHKLRYPCAYDFARSEGIDLLDMADLLDVIDPAKEFLGISARFHKIISEQIINLFSLGIVNLHGGELPRYRGVNIANHCILEGASQGAGTLHFIDPGIDTGPIIGRKYFNILATDTAYDVFLKTQSALMALLDSNLETILKGNICARPQQFYIDKGEKSILYLRKDIEKFRELDESMGLVELDRYARAFTFPGHEPAYFKFNNNRLYLATKYDFGN